MQDPMQLCLGAAQHHTQSQSVDLYKAHATYLYTMSALVSLGSMVTLPLITGRVSCVWTQNRGNMFYSDSQIGPFLSDEFQIRSTVP
jgi:hypothetical protein